MELLGGLTTGHTAAQDRVAVTHIPIPLIGTLTELQHDWVYRFISNILLTNFILQLLFQSYHPIHVDRIYNYILLIL